MIRLLVAAAIVMPCLGCASVTRGTTENISIATTPAGATAEISGLEIPTACITPCVVQAKRNADIIVAINKEGYEPQIIPPYKGGSGLRSRGIRRQPPAWRFGRHGRGCRYRRGAGSQAQSGYCHPATALAGTACNGKAAIAKTAASRAAAKLGKTVCRGLLELIEAQFPLDLPWLAPVWPGAGRSAVLSAPL
jgi:hypothetical protein